MACARSWLESQSLVGVSGPWRSGAMSFLGLVAFPSRIGGVSCEAARPGRMRQYGRWIGRSEQSIGANCRPMLTRRRSLHVRQIRPTARKWFQSQTEWKRSWRVLTPALRTPAFGADCRRLPLCITTMECGPRFWTAFGDKSWLAHYFIN